MSDLKNILDRQAMIAGRQLGMNKTTEVAFLINVLERKNELIEQLQARIDGLEQELKIARRTAGIFNTKADELDATVERLRGVVVNYHDENIAAEEAMNELWDIHNTTPHQSLNALKREAYEQGFLNGFDGGLEIDKKSFTETFDSSGAMDLAEQQKRHLAKLHGYRYAERVK